MTTPETTYAAAVATVADSQVGYNPGRTYSKYGEWYGLPTMLWCAGGSSWSVHEALGDRAAKAVIGVQPYAPKGRGYSWTVKMREWLREHGTWVALANAAPGDVLFFKYPTSDGRSGNVVNHVDTVTGRAAATYLPTVGFNTPRPGSGGDPSNGRGVWRHNRALTDPYIVDCYRPPWWRHPDLITYVQGGLDELGHDPGVIDGLWGTRTESAVTAFQKDQGLTVDGIPGPHTRATIALRLVDEVLPEITEEAELMAAKDEIIAAITQRIDRVAADVWREPIGAENAQARSWLRGGNLKAGRASNAAQEAVAHAAALEATLTAMAAGGADPAIIREAARKGAADALAAIRLTTVDAVEEG